MSRITTKHKARLEELLQELLPLLKRAKCVEDESQMLQEKILAFIDLFFDDIDAGKYKIDSFAKNTLPHVWTAISGLILDTHPDQCVPLRGLCEFKGPKVKWDPMYVQTYLFKFVWNRIGVQGCETPQYQRLYAWRRKNNEEYAERAKSYDTKQQEWGDVEYNALLQVALRNLTVDDELEDADKCARLIWSLAFFTGRRAWEEIGRISDFSLISDEEAALQDDPGVDGFLKIRNLAKKSTFSEIIIPVYNVKPEQLIEALTLLRYIEREQDWFKSEGDSVTGCPSTLIMNALMVSWRNFVNEEVSPCFKRLTSSGMRFNHSKKSTDPNIPTAHDMRRLAASYAFYRFNQSRDERGVDPITCPKGFTAAYLGHGVKVDESKATLVYTGLTYVGSATPRLRYDCKKIQ